MCALVYLCETEYVCMSLCMTLFARVLAWLLSSSSSPQASTSYRSPQARLTITSRKLSAPHTANKAPLTTPPSAQALIGQVYLRGTTWWREQWGGCAFVKDQLRINQ